MSMSWLFGRGNAPRAPVLVALLVGASLFIRSFLNMQDATTGVETAPRSVHPKAPFITSTLQQAASSRLGFGAQKTMRAAQTLYEGGHITYMRTDSTNLSAEALSMARLTAL